MSTATAMLLALVVVQLERLIRTGCAQPAAAELVEVAAVALGEQRHHQR